MIHRNLIISEYLELYKIIDLNGNNLDLFRKNYEYYSRIKNIKRSELKYKYYTNTEGSTQRYY